MKGHVTVPVFFQNERKHEHMSSYFPFF